MNEIDALSLTPVSVLVLGLLSLAVLILPSLLLNRRKQREQREQSRPLITPTVVYNTTIAAGVLLIGIGVGLWHGIPAGMVATGVLMLVLTIYVLERTRRPR